MPIVFISDLHLHSEAVHLTKKFLHFIQNEASSFEVVYILGDLFDVWIGDDAETDYHQMISNHLFQLSQRNIKIYFLPGNRDFLIGAVFSKASGMELIKEPLLIDLYGRKALLLHGDTLCLEDYAYQRYRRIVRNPFIQKLFLALPLTLRKNIASRLRNHSHAHQMIVDASPEAITEITQKYEVDLLIHGHTHQASIHFFLSLKKMLMRVVLSDWGNLGNMLVCHEDGSLRLTYF